MPIVHLQDIRKVYDTKVAVEGLTLSIEPGTMFGLLGPNGSGKTSSIRMMIGITVPDSGTVSLFDQPFHRGLLARVGYLPEERGLYKKMKVLDQLVFLGQLRGLSATVAAERARSWGERLHIAEAMPKKTEDLSKGMQQKIQFIAALLHDPDLIIMDEPFSGLDPVNAVLLMDTLVELRRAGKAVLFSTHRMDQVEKLCDNIALISGGKLILSGSMREVKAMYPHNRILIDFQGDAGFLSHPSVESAKRYNDSAEIQLRASATLAEDAQSLLALALSHATVTRFEVKEPTLEDIFIEKVLASGTEVSVGCPSMHNVWLIARREYMERIRTRGFILTTILIPLLMGGVIFGSSFLGSKTKPASHIAVVSSDTQLALDLQTQLATGKGSHIAVDAMGDGPDTRDTLDQQMSDDDIDGYLWVEPAAGPKVRPSFTYTPRGTADEATKATLNAALRTVLLHEQLGHRGIVAGDVDAMLQPIDLRIGARDKRSGKQADADSSAISVMVLFFLMYMVIMLYGMNVARSIIEEKTSRIFEVMLATIRPQEMMAGKILGVGSVGLTQVAIWLAAGLLLSSTSLAANLEGTTVHIALNYTQVCFFFVYFILGYLFYSSIAAALGAMTNSEQELQQLNMFLVLPLAVCAIALRSVMASPDSLLARVLALIPPFTPLVMYLRVSLGKPSLAEIALSIALTSISIYAIIWVTSRIYRVGVLMYGKRPNLAEIVRWLRYS